MLRLFGITGRNVFLSAGVICLVVGGLLTLSGDGRDGALLLRVATIAMLGAIACAISEHRDRRD